MEHRHVTIYTDGACSSNPGTGGWAAVIITPDGQLFELGGNEPTTTCNRMEMTAAIQALADTTVKEHTGPVTLFSDSKILIGGIARYAWEHPSRPNHDLWKQIANLIQPIYKFYYINIKGHAGHPVNERCDTIAKAFSKNKTPKLYKGTYTNCGYPTFPPKPCHLQPQIKPKNKPSQLFPRDWA